MHLQIVPREPSTAWRPRPLAGVFYPDTLWRVMASNAWFALLDASTQGKLIGNSMLANLPAGEEVLSAGAHVALVGVVRGVLKITGGDASQRHTIEVVEPGQWLAPLQPGPAQGRAWCIEAMKPCTVLLLSASALRGLLASCPDVPEALAQLNWHLATRLMDRFETVSLPAYEERVRRVLALLASRFGEHLDDGWTQLTAKFNQSEIAALARVSRARTNEVLKDFSRSGLVRTRDGRLELAPCLSPRLRA
jgi:CRP-like cAMP-binding protein